MVIALADGMGGRSSAGPAADGVVAAVRAGLPDGRAVAGGRHFDRLLVATNRAILADPAAGETTAVVLGVDAAGRVGGASVGDSEAWVVTAGECFALTAGQVRKPGLGTGVARPTLFRARLDLGSVLIVATDGLFKYADRAAILRVARGAPFDEMAGALVALARLPSGAFHDDVAVAVCTAVRC